MIEWITLLLDSKFLMRANGILGFLLLGFFVFFYFSKEGRDERGRGLIATASLIAFVALFFLLNIVANNLSWLMDNHVRLMNGLQLSYTLFLFIADIALVDFKENQIVLKKVNFATFTTFQISVVDFLLLM